MIKLIQDLANFALSLVFGTIALASALFTTWNALKLYFAIGGARIQIEHEATFLLFGVICTFVAYCITAALRGWKSPLGKCFPGSPMWR
jgi:predicted Co/Zn/Cd cation transporter (cation efflux family)